MLSQTVEYSLRAMVTLAQNDGSVCTAQQLARLTQVPGSYLSKVMQLMVKSGLVSSQRGLHGGFVLLRKPDEISVAEVIESVQPFKRMTECPAQEDSRVDLNPLYGCLSRGMALAEQVYRETSLAQLSGKRGSNSPVAEADLREAGGTRDWVCGYCDDVPSEGELAATAAL